MASRILRFCFYTLFGFTPLLFTPYNNELFEFNKMLLVYGLTVIISAAWVYQMLSEKRLIFKKTPLDIFLVLFFFSQVLSTFFSIDIHTSIWGYYSRSNGGLLSIASYLLLYWAFVSNFDKADAIKFLKASVIGGVLVALWAIPEHFGYSPSCALLVGRWSADCWVQDVQSRVFATLGQPNWLAAYMAMLVFPTIYFFITEKTPTQKMFYYISSVLLYLAFTFTFSRGGMLGILGGFGMLASFLAWQWWHSKKEFLTIKTVGVVAATFIVINLIFGSALTGSFRLIKENAPPPRPALTGGTQLENGGTESGQIRLIVWEGALDIFKHYPVFGSGVETFAYSYYMFRPVAHNLVSEWDFLYNKAHNEYLNYLSTTGTIGFISYLGFIIIFIIWSGFKLFDYQISYQVLNSKLNKVHHLVDHESKLLIVLLLASYVSYLIQNFFGFSVVMIAVLFYLIPAFVFVMTGQTKSVETLKDTPLHFLSFFWIVYKRDLYTIVLKIIVVLFGSYLLLTVLGVWRADVNYKLGSDASDAGNATKAYNSLLQAYDLNPREPLYQSDFGNIAGSAAVSLAETDATQAAELKDQAILFTESSLNESPANVSLWRTAIRTYYVLSVLDPQYDTKTIEVIDKTISLAPTDPKLYFNKALILSQQKKPNEAIEALKKAIELKPNYREAKLSLADLYLKNNQKDQATLMVSEVLKAIPNDPDALKILQEATESASTQ